MAIAIGPTKYKEDLLHLCECGKEARFMCPAPGCNYKTKVKTNVKVHTKRQHKTLFNKIVM